MGCPLCWGNGDGILDTRVYSLAVSTFTASCFACVRRTGFRSANIASKLAAIAPVYKKGTPKWPKLCRKLVGQSAPDESCCYDFADAAAREIHYLRRVGRNR